jgi:hypothetical protein
VRREARALDVAAVPHLGRDGGARDVAHRRRVEQRLLEQRVAHADGLELDALAGPVLAATQSALHHGDGDQVLVGQLPEVAEPRVVLLHEVRQDRRGLDDLLELAQAGVTEAHQSALRACRSSLDSTCNLPTRCNASARSSAVPVAIASNAASSSSPPLPK